jgi:DHA1 family arabinose polymer transporter-like MFS transporter
LPIAYGYGFTSADWVGAGMAGAGIFIAMAVIWIRKRNAQRVALQT